MSEDLTGIANNLRTIEQQIEDAAVQSGRQASDVRLVAITKYVDADVVRALIAAGCTTFGESRPQALWEKAEALRDTEIEWHFIGHLQRNKVRRTLPFCSYIHSGDSLRLLEELNDEAKRLERKVPVLLEVNISGDVEKHGLSPETMEQTLVASAALEHLQINGLMGMAARGTNAEEARRDFAALRELRDELRANCPESVELNELSMGMSGDFMVAIEEGATFVRVGSALYDGFDR